MKIDYLISKLKSISYAFCSMIAIQSIVCLGTFPILIHAGLPLMLLGFIGNIVYIPFLVLFLALSFILFVGLLFNIHLYPLALALNILTSVWYKIISLGMRYGYAFFIPLHPWWPFLICWGGVYVLLHVRCLRSTRGRWHFACLSVFFLSLFLLKVLCKPLFSAKFEDKAHSIEVVLEKKGLVVYDKLSYIGLKKMDDFFLYTFFPFLARSFGTHSIEEYHIESSNKRVHEYAHALENSYNIKKVIIHPCS